MRFDVDAEIAAHERRQRGEADPAPERQNSPIEDALFVALRIARDVDRQAGGGWLLGSPACEVGPVSRGRLVLEHMVLLGDAAPIDDIRYDVYICRQVAIGTYFADILLWSPGFALAVECDGFEFHDRTKQQAAYDRARDRELLRRGVPTIRFTGSEINHDANRCAREIADTWLSIIARWAGDDSLIARQARRNRVRGKVDI